MFVAPVLGSVGYQIQNSLRFNGTNSYATRAAGAATTTTIFTYSFWFKASEISSGNLIFAMGYFDGSNYSYLSLNAGQIFFPIVIAGVSYVLTGTPLYRDPSGWYHIVVGVDTTQVTAANRVSIEVNGAAIALTGSYPPQNQTYHLGNGGSSQYIGINQALSAANAWDGYLAEWHYVNGQKLAASNFGAADSVTGQDRPKKYAGTYGASGYYLDFSDGSSTTTLGYDKSGNGNNWTLTNMVRSAGVTDCWMTDTPTNNYATLNPLNVWVGAGTPTLTNGGLTAAASAAAGNGFYRSTLPVSQFNSYFEVFGTAVGVGGTYVGVGTIDCTGTTNLVYYNAGDGKLYKNGVAVATYATFTTNDIVGFTYDPTTDSLTTYKNNVSQGSYTVGLTGDLFAVVGDGSGLSVTLDANFGQRSFAYPPPAGYKALCTANLPTPSIANPSNHFQAKLDTGANIKTTAEAVFPSNFFEWIKDRANVNNHQLVDIVRGSSAVLQSNATAAETTYSAPSGSSVAWVWKAGGTPVTNNAGSISSQVSANVAAGFSIVTYTGTGANATVGHGLGVAPKMVIVKQRTAIPSAQDWPVYHASSDASPQNYGLYLNLTNAKTANILFWNNTAPTSSTFSIGTGNGVGVNTGNYVAYCFAEVPGFSKIDKYTGNGSADGPFVYCGFRPKWLLIKNASVGGANYDWWMVDVTRDTTNVVNLKLAANLSDAELGATASFDILSNGFKVRTASYGSINGSGNTMIFAAFAECPFQYANAR